MPLGINKYQTRGLPQRKVAAGGYDPNAGTGATGSTDPGYTYLEDGNKDGGSSAAAIKNADTARLKFLAEQAAGTAAAEKAQFGAANQLNYLRTLLGQGVPSSITGEIGAQETAGRDYINTTATNLLARLAGARDTGQQFTTQGYDTLRNYLTANPANAYAQAQRAVPTVTNNALAQYMQAQGVDPSMAQPAVDTANQQALGGATNYNQLLNVLTGAESAGQASRMSEEQMARALAGSQLQSIYGSGRANVESEQLAALNALATQISNARIEAQKAQTAQEQAIQTAIAGLVGTGNVCPPGLVKSADGQSCVTPSTEEKDFAAEIAAAYAPKEAAYNRPAQTNEQIAELRAIQEAARLNEVRGGGVKTSPSVAALAAIPVKASNTALQKRIDDFVAERPRATPAAVAEEFPELAKAIAKKKKK
jgi:hypothetical protein